MTGIAEHVRAHIESEPSLIEGYLLFTDEAIAEDIAEDWRINRDEPCPYSIDDLCFEIASYRRDRGEG